MNDPSKQIVNWKNVSTTEEKIAELETSCKAMTAEIKKLKAELAETQGTIWIPKIGEEYLHLATDGIVSTETNDKTAYDTGVLNMNGVFRVMKDTDKHLEWYANNVLRVQNKLMQLHELLCPDYFPNWENNNESKFYLCYNYVTDMWYYDYQYNESNYVVYFTGEAAEKACEILNREKFIMEE